MILAQDIIKRGQDYVSNYSVAQMDEEQWLRATDHAVNSLFIKLGGLQDKKNFLYTQDVSLYDLEDDFKSFIGLYYADPKYNLPQNRWSYRPYTDIKAQTGQRTGNKAAVTTINGRKQLMLLGLNIFGGTTLDPMDTVLWTPDMDASDIEFDYFNKKQGSASQRFTITENLGEAIVGRSDIHWDFTSLHEREGFLRIYAYTPSNDFANIQARYGSSPSDYFTITITTDANGDELKENDWNLLSFATKEKVATGNPNQQDINFFEIIYNLNPGYGTVANNRLDYLYTAYPDEMELVFYTNKKGVNANGDPISKITTVSDEIDLDEDFIEPLAVKAAGYAWPQLKGSAEYWMLYKAEWTDFLKTMGRTRPKIMNQNDFQSSRLRR